VQQTVCDHCGKPTGKAADGDKQLVRVFIEMVQAGHQWRDYCLGCARTLTITNAYAGPQQNDIVKETRWLGKRSTTF
jgi:hypothetical protein